MPAPTTPREPGSRWRTGRGSCSGAGPGPVGVTCRSTWRRLECRCDEKRAGRARWQSKRGCARGSGTRGWPPNRPLQTDGHCSAFGRPCPPLNAGVGWTEKIDQRVGAEVMPSRCLGTPSQPRLQMPQLAPTNLDAVSAWGAVGRRHSVGLRRGTVQVAAPLRGPEGLDGSTWSDRFRSEDHVEPALGWPPPLRRSAPSRPAPVVRRALGQTRPRGAARPRRAHGCGARASGALEVATAASARTCKKPWAGGLAPENQERDHASQQTVADGRALLGLWPTLPAAERGCSAGQ